MLGNFLGDEIFLSPLRCARFFWWAIACGRILTQTIVRRKRLFDFFPWLSVERLIFWQFLLCRNLFWKLPNLPHPEKIMVRP